MATCDAALCSDCAEPRGDLDFCPQHAAQEVPLPLVLNRHRYLPTPGCGPARERTGRERRPPLPEPWVYVGRGTPLGNPYRREQHGDAAIGMYRRWLHFQLTSGNELVLAAMRQIEPGSHLVCSCAPKPCHADVIVRAWAWLRGL